MSSTNGWRRYVRLLGGSPDANVDAELAFHLEMRARDLAALGLPIAEARTEATRRFGDVERVRAECRQLERTRAKRDARRRAFADLGQDISFAMRSLARQPAFTVSAVLTLALGIGVNAAIFSGVNAFLIKPLAVRDPKSVVAIAQTLPGSDLMGGIGYLDAQEMRERKDVFEDVATLDATIVAFRADKDRSREFGQVVTGNYFTMLGVAPAKGRLFGEGEARQRSPVIVLNDAFWARKFDRDPTVVGRQVFLNGAPFTIIGVLPASFIGTQQMVLPAFFVALDALPLIEPGAEARITKRGNNSMRVFGRLKAGVSLARARAVLNGLAVDLQRRYPDSNNGVGFFMDREVRTRPEISVARTTPWVAATFLGLVSLALLAACANVTNLLLVRATARQGEIAVRRALGAAPSRLTRQLLTESLILAILALGVAVFIASGIIAWLNALPITVDAPVHFGIALDWRFFAYAATTAVVAGVLAGLAPTVMGNRLQLSETLKEGGRAGSAGRSRGRLRNALVVSQVAVSLVLLVSAALFMRSMQRTAGADLGFRADGVYMAAMDVPPRSVEGARGPLMQDQLRDRLLAIPGVTAVGFGSHVPFGGNLSDVQLFAEGRGTKLGEGMFSSFYGSASPDYLGVLGFRLTQGRVFASKDDASAPRVMIMNEALAQVVWPGESALGKRVRLNRDSLPTEVVGVIANAKYLFINESPRPFLYVPIAQVPNFGATFFMHTRQDPSTIGDAVRTAIMASDPEAVPYALRPMSESVRDGIAFFIVRLGATLAAAIGMLGLMQMLVGLYGVLSYTVAQRTKEFGIRMALGAQQTDVIRSVLREGSRLVAIGLTIGLVIAFAGTRVMQGMLFGISPTDAVAFLGSVALLAGCALFSSYLPARRASRMAPTNALRADS